MTDGVKFVKKIVLERFLGPLLPGSGHHMARLASLAQSIPEASMRRSPGAQPHVAGVSWIGLDEDRSVGLDGNWHLEREAAHLLRLAGGVRPSDPVTNARNV